MEPTKGAEPITPVPHLERAVIAMELGRACQGERTDLLRERAEIVFGAPDLAIVVLRDELGSVHHEGVVLRPGEVAWYDPRVSAFRVKIGEEWFPIYIPGDLAGATAGRHFYKYPALVDIPTQ